MRNRVPVSAQVSPRRVDARAVEGVRRGADRLRLGPPRVRDSQHGEREPPRAAARARLRRRPHGQCDHWDHSPLAATRGACAFGARSPRSGCVSSTNAPLASALVHRARAG